MRTIRPDMDQKASNGKSIRIALLHLSPRYDDVQHNLTLLETLFLKAVDLGADLVLTPELAVSGYEFNKIMGTEWIKTDGPKIIERFSRLAREQKVALILGSPIYAESSGKYYNAAIFIDEFGQVLGVHHKILVLPRGSEEWSSPGKEIKPIAWRGNKIGLLICADAYPEKIAAELAKQGAQVLISAAAWAPGMHGPDGEWEQRSKETGLSFIVCNRTGKGAQVDFEGSSSIVAVGGRRIVEYARKEPAVLTIDVDKDSWFPQSEKFTVSS